MARRIEHVAAGALFLGLIAAQVVLFLWGETKPPLKEHGSNSFLIVLLLAATVGWGKLMVPLLSDGVLLTGMLAVFVKGILVLLAQAREEIRLLPFLLDTVILVLWALMTVTYGRLVVRDVRFRRSAAASSGAPR